VQDRHIGLTSAQVQGFVDDGFVKIENAFSSDLARQCRDELWADIGLSPNEPERWTRAVIGSDPSFRLPSLRPRTRNAFAEPTINLRARAVGLRPQALEPFRSAFRRQSHPAMMAGMSI
jgi:hypothetical protein